VGRNRPECALLWAGNLNEGDARNDAIASACASWAQNLPRDAAQFVANMSPGEAQKRAVLSVVSTWADAEPEAAATGQPNFLKEASERKLFKTIIQNWGAQDSVAAGDWIQALPAGPTRDSALEAYYQPVDGVAPELAARWTRASRIHLAARPNLTRWLVSGFSPTRSPPKPGSIN